MGRPCRVTSIRAEIAPASRMIPKPSRYFPRSSACSTSPRSSSAPSSRNAVDLCTEISVATSVTPASPRLARISRTLIARSTDCTPLPVDSGVSPLVAAPAAGCLLLIAKPYAFTATEVRCIIRNPMRLALRWGYFVEVTHRARRGTHDGTRLRLRHRRRRIGRKRPREPAVRRPLPPGARPRGRPPGLPVGRLHPDAGRAAVPDRQPVLRLEVLLRAGAVHERPPDLPPRQPDGLPALGSREGDAVLGLRALPALLQPDGELPRRGSGGRVPRPLRAARP